MFPSMLKLRRAGKAQSRAVTSDFILKSRTSAISDWPARGAAEPTIGNDIYPVRNVAPLLCSKVTF